MSYARIGHNLLFCICGGGDFGFLFFWRHDTQDSAAGDGVRDAAIIAAAQRVEHYEMAGYGTARTYATLLGFDEAANSLEQTLEEEKEADQTLSGLAEELNVEALEAGGNGAGEKAGQGTSRNERAKKSTTRSKRAA